MQQIEILNGMLLDVLKSCPDNYFDSIVTDPPYGIGFMGKEWDTFKPGYIAEKLAKDGRGNRIAAERASTAEFERVVSKVMELLNVPTVGVTTSIEKVVPQVKEVRTKIEHAVVEYKDEESGVVDDRIIVHQQYYGVTIDFKFKCDAMDMKRQIRVHFPFLHMVSVECVHEKVMISFKERVHHVDDVVAWLQKQIENSPFWMMKNPQDVVDK